jgi:hypothetical protein
MGLDTVAERKIPAGNRTPVVQSVAELPRFLRIGASGGDFLD